MVNVLLPLILILLLSFFSVRFNVFDKSIANQVTKLVFFLVLPLTIAFDISRFSFLNIVDLQLLTGYCLASISLILISWFVTTKIYKRKGKEVIANLMGSYHINTAFVAIPIFLLLFDSIIPVINIILFQSIMNFILLTCYEKLDKKGGEITFKPSHLLKIPARNPVLIAILLGFILSFFQFSIPTFLNNTFNIIQQSMSFLSIFALGASLACSNLLIGKSELSEISLICFFKLVLHPIFAYLIGKFLIGLSGKMLFILVLLCGMPAAKVTFIFAHQYNVAQRRSSLFVSVSTILCFISLSLISAIFS